MCQKTAKFRDFAGNVDFTFVFTRVVSDVQLVQNASSHFVLKQI